MQKNAIVAKGRDKGFRDIEVVSEIAEKCLATEIFEQDPERHKLMNDSCTRCSSEVDWILSIEFYSTGKQSGLFFLLPKFHTRKTFIFMLKMPRVISSNFILPFLKVLRTSFFQPGENDAQRKRVQYPGNSKSSNNFTI